MRRLFVAVELPYAVMDAVAVRADGLEIRGGRKAAAPWHLTLQFLGDTELAPVASALDGLDRERGGQVRLGGTGAFPNARRGRVLWIGVAEGHGVLARLARAVADRLAPLGFEPEQRTFRPHLTLVRCTAPTDLRAPVAALGADPVGPAWNVDTLTVYESQLRDDGARYLARATIELPR